MSVFPSISAPFSPCCEVDVTPATRYCGARSFPLHVKIPPRLHPHKNFPSSPKPRRTALDKPMKAGIIKITKDTSTSGRPRSVHKIKKNFLKPSLCRVAVSPVNADRNSQSKDMESQSDRHRNTPFTEDSVENRPSLFWRPWGSKRTITILPDQSKNVNQWRMLCHWKKKSMAFYTTGGRCR